MSRDAHGVPTQLIAEVALWCSLQKLTAVHEDSPDEARRRALMKEAAHLLDAARSRGSGWLEELLPDDRRWTRAMDLIKEADPDSLAPLENQLRSLELKPPDSIGSSYSDESRREIVNGVIDRRSSPMQARLPQNPAMTDRFPGRSLLYVPSENVSDGASRYASNGFFDLYDCPPWDTWLQYSRGTLVSWVPEVLIPLAQSGIDANPVECIRWSD
ncbi:MAG: hypothetical protein NTZ56_16545 [Acidobacteria bacterium]|nr:hypothetical protein [Acidobacteriota bacterium]